MTTSDTPPVSVGEWRTPTYGGTWRPLEDTLRIAEKGYGGEIAGIEVRGEEFADGRIDWHVSIPECDLTIRAQHLGQWVEALLAARDEINRLS